jgi:hypothetical protein
LSDERDGEIVDLSSVAQPGGNSQAVAENCIISSQNKCPPLSVRYTTPQNKLSVGIIMLAFSQQLFNWIEQVRIAQGMAM